ncbi:MAG TPA: cytochrome C oxidase subunit IV family protein [Actinomycetota bacterium]
MDAHQVDQAHPKEKLYVKVALWLALVTGIEIFISYAGLPDWITILSLVALSLIKFLAVVGYFMHLKFDARLLRKPFVGGLLLAITIYAIVLLAFTLHDGGV